MIITKKNIKPEYRKTNTVRGLRLLVGPQAWIKQPSDPHLTARVLRRDITTCLTKCLKSSLMLRHAFDSNQNNTGIFDMRLMRSWSGRSWKGPPDIVFIFHSINNMAEVKPDQDCMNQELHGVQRVFDSTQRDFNNKLDNSGHEMV